MKLRFEVRWLSLVVQLVVVFLFLTSQSFAGGKGAWKEAANYPKDFCSKDVNVQKEVVQTLSKDLEKIYGEWLEHHEEIPLRGGPPYRTYPNMNLAYQRDSKHFLSDIAQQPWIDHGLMKTAVTPIREVGRVKPYANKEAIRVMPSSDGKFRLGDELLGQGKGTEYLFAMDDQGNYYVGPEKIFVNHPNLVSGTPVALAGTVFIKDGVVQRLANNSGHYAPPSIALDNGLDAFKKKYHIELKDDQVWEVTVDSKYTSSPSYDRKNHMLSRAAKRQIDLEAAKPVAVHE